MVHGEHRKRHIRAVVPKRKVLRYRLHERGSALGSLSNHDPARLDGDDPDVHAKVGSLKMSVRVSDDHCLDAELFAQLALKRVPRSFLVFHVAAGKVPCVGIPRASRGAVDQQRPTVAAQ